MLPSTDYDTNWSINGHILNVFRSELKTLIEIWADLSFSIHLKDKSAPSQETYYFQKGCHTAPIAFFCQQFASQHVFCLFWTTILCTADTWARQSKFEMWWQNGMSCKGSCSIKGKKNAPLLLACNTTGVLMWLTSH